MRFSTRCLWISFALATALLAEPAVAQDEPAGEAPDAVTAPKLVRFVEATLPDGTVLSEQLPVLLDLTIDEQGHVADAAVLESSGREELDRAVLDAVKSFEFEPAKRGETPVAVKIRYRYVVQPTAAAPAPEPPAANEPAPAPAPAATEQPPKPKDDKKPVAADELEEFTGTAEVEAPPREVTKRSIGEEKLTRIPGTRGDALRAIEVMPGVARTSEGTPLLRGAAWNESQALLDGIPVPFLYHFGGLTSFMNSRLIGRLDLYPSNFSTRYGRVAGGVVDVRARDPKTDRVHAVADVNLIDSSLLVETPLGENTAVALAARRSNIDFVFENFVPEDAYSVVAAPLYWDYQAIVSQKIGANHRLRVLGYGSRDSLELFFSNPNDEDPALAGQIAGSLEFHRVQLELQSKLSSSATQELILAVGRQDAKQTFGEFVQEYGGQDLNARAEWSFELSEAVRVTTGADLFGWFMTGRYHGPLPGALEGDPGDDDTASTRRIASLELDDWDVVRPGAYVDVGIRPVPALLVTPGVRADYFSDLHSWSVDPRLTARYELSPATALKAGVGRYTQAPELWQTLAPIGNPELDPYWAIQSSAGFEQKFGETVKFGVEGFYKWLGHRAVATRNNAPPRYVNDGEGRIVGAEFSTELTPRKGTFAYLAYTLSRSERRDLDGRWRLFDQDQTHILSLAASHDLGAGWEVGARFRLVSGNPSTPIEGAVYDARSGVYVPQFGGNNSTREPFFHQLDVRVEKAFQIGQGSLAVYLDVQNAYNAENVEGTRYSYDYREKEEVTGLPIFPNFGVRGEL